MVPIKILQFCFTILFLCTLIVLYFFIFGIEIAENYTTQTNVSQLHVCILYTVFKITKISKLLHIYTSMYTC